MKITDFKSIVQSIFFVMMLVFFLTMLLCVSIFSKNLIELKTSKMDQVKKLTYQKILLEERFIFEEVMSISNRAIEKRFERISQDVGLSGTSIDLLVNGKCQLGRCKDIEQLEVGQSGLFKVESSDSFKVVYRMSVNDIEYGILMYNIPQSNFAVSLSFIDQVLLYLIPFTILFGTWLVWYFYIEKRVISPFISKLVTNEKERAILKLTKQVAHDIRSPLAALEIVMEDIKNLPEESRELTLHAINRIQDIANNLSKEGGIKQEKISDSLISIVVDNIVNEKSIEYQSKGNIHINYTDNTTTNNFVKIVESDLSRAISNIVNNSVEALNNTGEIDINLSEGAGFVCLTLMDNGGGFPDEILNNSLRRGRTIGKKEGQGLGLFHAYEVINGYHGQVELSNNSRGGATVIIKLPIAESPKWFRSEIKLVGFGTVLVIDDDRSIHDLWRKIISARQPGLQIKDAYNLADAREMLKTSGEDTVVLIDYDLRDSKNGIDIIEEFQLKNVALVTSNYDTPHVVEYCNQNNLQLIPKQIVSSITVS